MPGLPPVQAVLQSSSAPRIGSVVQAALIFGTFMSTTPPWSQWQERVLKIISYQPSNDLTNSDMSLLPTINYQNQSHRSAQLDGCEEVYSSRFQEEKTNGHGEHQQSVPYGGNFQRRHPHIPKDRGSQDLGFQDLSVVLKIMWSSQSFC